MIIVELEINGVIKFQELVREDQLKQKLMDYTRYGQRQYNQSWAVFYRKRSKGNVLYGNSKLDHHDKEEIKRLREKFTIAFLAKKYNVNRDTISQALKSTG